MNKDFINLDYLWVPSMDVCWDIVAKKYPFPDASMEGIYTEHCLEHIPYDKCIENLKEFHRLLKPGFKNISKESFRKGRDSRLLIDREDRVVESLYVEATK